MSSTLTSVHLGPTSWWLVLVVATATAVVLDVRLDDTRKSPRLGRALALLFLGGTAIWAVALGWDPSPSVLRRTLEAVAWWLAVIPVLWLGALTSQPAGASAISRLAAVQAVPAIILSFGPALGWRALGALSAGVARIAVPPLHPMNLAAAESLSPGALGLVLVFGLAVGGPLAVRGMVGISESVSQWIFWVLALVTGAAGAASLRDPHLLRRVATWSAVQGALAVMVAAVPLAAVGRRPPELALAHLGACAAVLPAVILALGRMVAIIRVPDLRAHGGLGREAPLRAQVLMAAVFLAVLCSTSGAVTLVVAVGVESGFVSRLAYGAALVGWFGVSLAVVLGGYRVARGQRPSPGDASPELGRAEGILLIALLAFAVLARVLPGLWEVPMLPSSGDGGV
jgi:hypothetical protein